MSEPDYRVVSQVHINQFDSNTGQVVPGWNITVRDSITGTVVPVFVPDANYGPEQARALIEHALGKVRAVHGLGQ